MFPFKLFTPGQINESELRNESHLLEINGLHFQVILPINTTSTSSPVFEIHLIHEIVARAIHRSHIFRLRIQLDLEDGVTSRRFSIFDCLEHLTIVKAVFEHVFCLINVFEDVFREALNHD